MFTALRESRDQPSVRNFVAAELLGKAERAKSLPFGPELSQLNARARQQRIDEPDRLSMGVGCLKIFGLVTSRRKLACTIGISAQKSRIAAQPTA